MNSDYGHVYGLSEKGNFAKNISILRLPNWLNGFSGLPCFIMHRPFMMSSLMFCHAKTGCSVQPLMYYLVTVMCLFFGFLIWSPKVTVNRLRIIIRNSVLLIGIEEMPCVKFICSNTKKVNFMWRTGLTLMMYILIIFTLYANVKTKHVHAQK